MSLNKAEKIKRFGDVSKLSKADQYFNEVKERTISGVNPGLKIIKIMTIPRLGERLECMLYRRKLELDIEEIRPELDILRNASRELRSSGKFKQLLQVRRLHIATIQLLILYRSF